MKTNFLLTNNFYKIEDIDSILTDIDFIKTNKKIEYGNVSCVLDTEVSSFYDKEGNKSACLYAFTFGFNGKSILGRTYEDMLYLFNEVSKRYNLDKNKRIIFYVHNLGYDFQFIRKWFLWEQVFSLSQREPIKALTDIGIEFRCSYALSGYSLESVGKNLVKYKVEKLKGDLDYSLIRNPLTPLTDKEVGYILNDGLVVMAYIQELIETHGNITKLPLTKTGFVRKYVMNQCLYESKSHKKLSTKYFRYHTLMKGLGIKSTNEYLQLKQGFSGGFTHANAIYSNQEVFNVHSYDFTSSYPAVMVTEQYPMSSGELITIHSKEELEKNLSIYCCLFEVTFNGLESITSIDHPISYSKCIKSNNVTVDNGRIIDAEMIKLVITEQDFFIYKKFYKWESMSIKNFRRYRKGYLPKDFILAILKLYKDKTELKDVEGFEREYMSGKENLNACYGMSVTDICRDEIIYNKDTDTWETEKADLVKCLDKYNNQRNRFLCYQWGVWVTAYARKNLFSGIYELKNDYIYSDTDSVKFTNLERHLSYFEEYNKNMEKKLVRVLNHYNIPVEYAMPKTKEGKTKILGVWDYEGKMIRFKTLGAKRYLYEHINKRGENELVLTVSGVNKNNAIPYLLHTYKTYDNIFKNFTDGLYIPATYQELKETKSGTGKNTHTYIDEEREGIIKDYLGNYYEYHEKSCIFMNPCDYSLSLSRQYLDYIMGIKEVIR